MSPWSLLILFLLTIGGSLFVFVFKTKVDRYLEVILTFSGAYLFGISTLHLLPELYSGHYQNAGIYILLGFALQIILEFFSHGIEHGHLHIHNPGKFFPWSIALGLAIHSFLEGMPLAESLGGQDVSMALYYGILLHKIPAAFVLLAVMRNYNVEIFKIVVVLLVFAAMTPIGALLSEYFFLHYDPHGSDFFKILLAVVVGAFLHISTTILFEAGDRHKYNYYKVMAIIFGFCLAWLTTTMH